SLLHCELTDAGAVEKLISAVRPDRIFHLAAQSFVQSSVDEPAATMRINVESQLNVLEAIRRHNTKIRVHVAGSSEEYGMVYPDEVPMKETNPLRPLSPYAVSKVAQDKLAYQYFKSYGHHNVVTRGFTHTGPGRGTHFSASTFARQIALIEAGQHEPIVYVGDLTSKRDWTDVRDMVRAYWLALERAEGGEVYNVGRGRTWSIGEMLNILLSHSTVKIRTQEDPARLRPSDVPILWADASKFQRATGWEPRIPFEQTLRPLLVSHRPPQGDPRRGVRAPARRREPPCRGRAAGGVSDVQGTRTGGIHPLPDMPHAPQASLPVVREAHPPGVEHLPVLREG